MKQRKLWRWWQIGRILRTSTRLTLPLLGVVVALPGAGQIVPDTTLPINSIVTPNGQTLLIDGGTTAGRNLFHSFSQFSLLTNSTAFFNNGLGINNIFARVTGGSVSNIDGILAANGTANLFLINPNGVIFGPNAQLNLGGSFAATTANAISFGNQGAFNASVPNNPSLLTVNPTAFLFNQIAASTITNQANLEVSTGQNLQLVGGEVTLDAGKLLAPGGRVELGGVAGVGLVGLNEDGQNFRLNFPTDIQRADIGLNNGAEVNVLAGGGGDISIFAQNLNISDASNLRAGIAPNMGDALSQAGDIDINATGAITLVAGSRIVNSLREGAVGNGGNININAIGAITLDADSRIINSVLKGAGGNAGDINISADTLLLSEQSDIANLINGSEQSNIANLINGPQNTGNININANFLSLSQESFIDTGVLEDGNAGNININANSVYLSNESGLTSGIHGQGNAGNITINADSVSVSDGSYLSSDIFGRGNGGNLNINANSLSVSDGSYLSSDILGQGDGGNLNINANSVSVTDRSYLSSDIFGQGDGGNLNINANSVSVSDGSYLSSDIWKEGKGNGGNLNINANSLSVTDRSYLSSDIFGQGDGGNLNINANSVSLRDGSYLSSDILGQGNAGSISIQARDSILLTNNSNFSSSLYPGSVGDAGNVNVETGALFLTDNAKILTAVNSGAVGNAGSINIKAGTLSLTNTSLGTFNLGQGIGGRISIQATGDISLTNTLLATSAVAGDAADIDVRSGSLSLTDNSELFTQNFGQGNAGNISVQVTGDVSVKNGSSFRSNVLPETVSNGGNIHIQAGSLSLSDNSVLETNTFGQGNAGNISVQATGNVSVTNNSFFASNVGEGAVGNGGNIDIQAASLSLSDNSLLKSHTSGQGNAGNISVQITGDISITNNSPNSMSVISTAVTEDAVGNGGNINITARSLSLNNHTGLSTGTLGQGNAGNISVRTIDDVSLSNASVFESVVYKGAVGNGGNIDITARSLSLNNVAIVSTTTAGQGNAGSISVRTINDVTLSSTNFDLPSVFLSNVMPGSEGNGGNIDITARSLSLNNNTALSTGTDGQGNAGNISVRTIDDVSLSNISSFGSSVQEGAVGNGGNIDITARSLSLNNQALLTTATAGQGNAGNILVQTINDISLSNTSLFKSSVQEGAVGNGGSIDITARSLSLNNDAGVVTATAGQGNAGNISVRTIDDVTLSSTNFDPPSVFLSNVISGGEGKGGDINITARSLSLTNGSVVSTSILGGKGRGGDITINAFDSVNISGFSLWTGEVAGSSLNTFTYTGGSGQAGNITVNTGTFNTQLARISSTTGNASNGGDISITAENLNLRDGTSVTTSSFSTGNAGNIQKIDVRNLYLDRSSITTTSVSGNGGNIQNLQVQDLLLLRNGSQISTTAGLDNSSSGNGGNININAGFISAVPSERSNILANAFAGNGGNIDITTQGTFGIASGDTTLPISKITASSQLGVNGVISIKTPAIDPAQGLLNLPTEVVDASSLIAQNCSASTQASSFVNTRRGGLPPSPDEPLSSDAIWQDTRLSMPTANQHQQPAAATEPSGVTTKAIAPATGWVFDESGQVTLVSAAPTPYRPTSTSTTCHP